MSKKEEYESRTEELLTPILAEHNFELVDVEYVKEGGSYYLRAYIDKEGGITIDDCETVSRALEVRLDEEDFVDDSYVLEVCSPGLTRPLKKDRDFERSIGKAVEIKLYAVFDGKKEWTGILTDYDRKQVTIELDGGDQKTFERDAIGSIRLAFDFQ